MLALDSFKINIARARELGELYNALSAIVTSAIDLDDLLRSQIVMSVSTLDYFVHEVVRQGMVAIYDGTRSAASGFSQFHVSLIEAKARLPGSSSAWVESAIRQRHSYMSFEDPDKIADAIRLIHEPPLWPALQTRLTTPAKDLKEQLRLIVGRRNKIAHEADADPSYPGTRWPITYGDATWAADFISKLVEAIDEEVK